MKQSYCQHLESGRRTIDVLIADDNIRFAQGLRVLLSQDREIDVVGTAKTALEAVALAKRLQPNIVILDDSLPDASAVATVKRIVSVASQSRIIILSTRPDTSFHTETHDAESIARFDKDIDLAKLVRAIKRAHALKPRTTRPMTSPELPTLKRKEVKQ